MRIARVQNTIGAARDLAVAAEHGADLIEACLIVHAPNGFAQGRATFSGCWKRRIGCAAHAYDLSRGQGEVGTLRAARCQLKAPILVKFGGGGNIVDAVNDFFDAKDFHGGSSAR